jgi:hypothetical protein
MGILVLQLSHTSKRIENPFLFGSSVELLMMVLTIILMHLNFVFVGFQAISFNVCSGILVDIGVLI